MNPVITRMPRARNKKTACGLHAADIERAPITTGDKNQLTTLSATPKASTIMQNVTSRTRRRLAVVSARENGEVTSRGSYGPAVEAVEHAGDRCHQHEQAVALDAEPVDDIGGEDKVATYPSELAEGTPREPLGDSAQARQPVGACHGLARGRSTTSKDFAGGRDGPLRVPGHALAGAGALGCQRLCPGRTRR